MMALHPTKDVMKSGNFSLAKPQRTQSQEMASFSTKTGKNLAVMQWLRPMFLPVADFLRSKLRQVGNGKKQPSCLRRASRQKTGKTADARFLLSQRKAPTGLNSQ